MVLLAQPFLGRDSRLLASSCFAFDESSKFMPELFAKRPNALPVAVARHWISRFLQFENKDIRPVRSTAMHDDIRHNKSFTGLVRVGASFGQA
jgi:hypothetical protein